MKKYLLFPILIIIIVGCDTDEDSNSSVRWKKLKINTDIDLTHTFFLNENVGYVAGIAPLQHIHFGVTEEWDDLTTFFQWINQPRIITDPIPYYRREILSTIPAIPQPSFFKTLDGGNSWSTISKPFISNIIDMHFVDESVGFVITKYEGVYKTKDGGTSWEKILESFIYLGDGNTLPSTDPYTNVYFVNEMNGFIFNDNDRNILIRTKDGGDTWDFIFHNQDNSMSYTKVKKICFPEKNETGYSLSRWNGLLYKTTDGGDTWDLIFSKPSYSIEDISFVDNNTGFYLSDYELYKTEDGGATWNLINNDFFILERAEQIISVTPNELLILNNHRKAIFHSHDGGHTFTKLSGFGYNALRNIHLNDVVMVDQGTGIAVGSKGNIFKYRNP